MIWWLRWQASNIFMRLAIKSMPKGAARDLYLEGLRVISRHIIAAVKEIRAKKEQRK